jgi:hypothetical protein
VVEKKNISASSITWLLCITWYFLRPEDVLAFKNYFKKNDVLASGTLLSPSVFHYCLMGGGCEWGGRQCQEAKTLDAGAYEGKGAGKDSITERVNSM